MSQAPDTHFVVSMYRLLDPRSSLDVWFCAGHTLRVDPLRIQIRQHRLIALLLQTLRRLLIHQTAAPPPPVDLLLFVGRRGVRHLPLRTLHHRGLDFRGRFPSRWNSRHRPCATPCCSRGRSGRFACVWWTRLHPLGEGEACPLEQRGSQLGGIGFVIGGTRLLPFGGEDGGRCWEGVEDGQVRWS